MCRQEEKLRWCKAVGISEVELIVSGGVRGIPTSLMTRGLMVEIYRYAGKYFGGNCINKFYEADSTIPLTSTGIPTTPTFISKDLNLSINGSTSSSAFFPGRSAIPKISACRNISLCR
jgi:hypothetical protein